MTSISQPSVINFAGNGVKEINALKVQVLSGADRKRMR